MWQESTRTAMWSKCIRWGVRQEVASRFRGNAKRSTTFKRRRARHQRATRITNNRMGKQIQLYLMPEDIAHFEDEVRLKGGVILRHYSLDARPSVSGTAMVKTSETTG